MTLALQGLLVVQTMRRDAASALNRFPGLLVVMHGAGDAPR
ncbi:hypothetical protein [Myxococcus stipitatus]|nr:hypothetical protein [Myxococcus stipitatus]